MRPYTSRLLSRDGVRPGKYDAKPATVAENSDVPHAPARYSLLPEAGLEGSSTVEAGRPDGNVICELEIGNCMSNAEISPATMIYGNDCNPLGSLDFAGYPSTGLLPQVLDLVTTTTPISINAWMMRAMLTMNSPLANVLIPFVFNIELGETGH
ncbi:hypothetical protein IQ06DRAFT_83432 [Phaeosphaeriaceae sp. SRC1lsM3a]|nr:hypothetical protein IQ06DRAFT_83432 [Stagonospora sp. SRC1lsM3a]